MRISAFALDGYAARPDLRARDLDEGLTVFAGPSHTGKTAVASLVAHVLYGIRPTIGGQTSHAERPYSEGELIVATQEGRFCLRRYDDVAPPGRLTVSALDGQTVDRHTVYHLLSHTPQKILAQLYAIDFRSPRALDDLLSEEFARGMRRVLGAKFASENPHTTARAGGAGALDALLSRRDELVRELEGRLARQRRQSREVDDRLRELDALYRERQREAVQLHEQLRTVESALREAETRLRYFRVQQLVDQEQSTATPAGLEPRLADLDDQVERWRAILADLDRREVTVRAKLAELHPDDAAAGLPLADQRAQLGVLRRLMSDLGGEIARLAGLSNGSACACRDAHARLNPIADTLNKQVAQLERSVDEQQRAVEYQDLLGEAEHLMRSRTELREQLEHLLDRRQALLRSARPTRRRLQLPGLPPDNGTNGKTATIDKRGDGIHDPHQLEKRCGRLQGELIELKQRLAAVEQNAGELQKRRDQLARNRTGPLSAIPIDQIRSELESIQLELERQLASGPGHQRRKNHGVDTLRASDLLAQMTSGRLIEIQLRSDGCRATVATRDNRRLAVSALPPADRDLVYLCLTLALVASHAGQGVQLPVVMDEPFARLDDQAAVATAGVLDDFARAGHQLLIFTACGAPADRFRSLGCSVRSMHELRTADEPIHGKAFGTSVGATPLESVAVGAGADSAGNIVEEQVEEQYDRFQLQLESPIGDFPALGPDTGAAFNAIGIHTVGDLLNAVPGAVQERLNRHDISSDIVRLWQTHLAFICYVPGVTLDDAQVLTGAGLGSPDELLPSRANEIGDGIRSYLDSDHGRRFRQRDYQCERRDVERWITNALRFRKQWQESSVATRWRQDRREGRRRASLAERPSGRNERRDRTSPRRPASKRPPRFYLDLTSPIVDAPSIGPKTAARLKAIGVHRVSDLLAIDPISVAQQLDLRQVNADHVTAWQQQSRLMCQVPRLRGHDAQILVACGFTEAEEIADMKAEELLGVVGPFCETKDGERILRGGQKPNLAEVANWIAWAGRRRVLEAA